MFREKKEKIMAGVAAALKKSGRTDDVTLLAVSKTFPVTSIIEAYREGQRSFGESRIQEALEKKEQLADFKDLDMHFIGHLQTNKVKFLKDNFKLIHSLDRLPLLDILERYFKKECLSQDVLIQVNIAKDPAKSGVDVDSLPALLEAASKCDHINIKGFAMMPPLVENPEENRVHFAETKKLMDKMNAEFACDNIDLKILSMGMTDDYKIAIEEGATLIRIGTALFGGRY